MIISPKFHSGKLFLGTHAMRIAYVLTSLGVGGAEREVLALARRMAERGHAALVLALREPQTEECLVPVPAVHLGMRKNPAGLCVGLFRARRILGDFRPDVIHSHGFHANIFARLLGLTMRGPVMLSTVHNVYEGGPLRMLAYRLTDGLCQRTTAVSQAVARRFVELRAVRREKCAVIPNAIEIEEVTPDSQRRNRTRKAMKAGEDFVWLAAGRVVPAKDYPNLLRAFARVHAERDDARLWIAGGGSEEEHTRLRSLAESLGIESCINWLGLRRDLPALFDAADGFVLSSAWEGMPLALMDAMAMEKPVVATDVGGVSELVAEAGRLVASRDSDALTQAMIETMRQPETERRALGYTARMRIREGFTMEKRAGEWEEFYRTALNEMRARIG